MKQFLAQIFTGGKKEGLFGKCSLFKIELNQIDLFEVKLFQLDFFMQIFYKVEKET